MRNMNRNLPPAAEPWGRKVDEAINSLKQRMDQMFGETQRSLKSSAATLGKVATQVADIATALEQTSILTEKLSGLKTYATTPQNLLEYIETTGFKTFVGSESVDVYIAPNTVALCTVSASATAAPRLSNTARGDTFRTSATFEVVGNSDYYMGSSITTAELQNTVLENGEYTGTNVTVNRIARLNLSPGLHTFRPGMYASISGGTEGIHAVNNMILVVQVIPGEDF